VPPLGEIAGDDDAIGDGLLAADAAGEALPSGAAPGPDDAGAPLQAERARTNGTRTIWLNLIGRISG
jgi:hypothetical protein